MRRIWLPALHRRRGPHHAPPSPALADGQTGDVRQPIVAILAETTEQALDNLIFRVERGDAEAAADAMGTEGAGKADTEGALPVFTSGSCRRR